MDHWLSKQCWLPLSCSGIFRAGRPVIPRLSLVVLNLSCPIPARRCRCAVAGRVLRPFTWKASSPSSPSGLLWEIIAHAFGLLGFLGQFKTCEDGHDVVNLQTSCSKSLSNHSKAFVWQRAQSAVLANPAATHRHFRHVPGKVPIPRTWKAKWPEITDHCTLV